SSSTETPAMAVPLSIISSAPAMTSTFAHHGSLRRFFLGFGGIGGGVLPLAAPEVTVDPDVKTAPGRRAAVGHTAEGWTRPGGCEPASIALPSPAIQRQTSGTR